MKQKIILQLLPVLCVLLQLSIQAQVTPPVNLHVAPAGTLPDMIAANEKYLITNLTLTGELNGTDILFIREMAGRDVNGNQTDGKLSVLDLSGADIVSGGASYYTHNDSIEYNTFSYCTQLTSVKIPNSVTSIGTNAFSFCIGLTSVTLSDSLRSIGVSAFGRCTGLTSVTIPNSVTSIGMGAFAGCNGLTSVSIGNNVESIGYEAFYNCTGLTSVTIPHSVTTLGVNAFYGCSELKSVTLSNSLISIESGTFSGCTGLTSISVPNSVEAIKSEAFFDCTGLTSVTIGDSISLIESWAFAGCTGLASLFVSENNKTFSSANGVLFNKDKTRLILFPKAKKGGYIIPESVISVGEQAFSQCFGLTSVTIPNSVISIGDYAFFGCVGLTSVTIPNKVTSISRFAFYACSGLTSVTIPASVISISEYAFIACNSLSEIHSNNPVPPSIQGTGAFQGVNKTTCSLYVPKGSSDSYRSANYWSEFFKIVEENVSVSTNDLSYRKITVYASHNKLNIETAEAIPVSIWLFSGKKVFEDVVCGKTTIQLNVGVYIVRTANESRKVIVY